MNRVRRLALITTIATFLLISIGGFVRAAGAGLGCPDWPRCYGGWFPPTSLDQVPIEHRADFNITKAWIEYCNRLVGVTIGFLIFGTLVQSLRFARREKGIVGPVFGAFILVGVEGWLGGQVVKHELDPRMVTLHLLLALVIVALLVYAVFNTFGDRLAPRKKPLEASARRFSLAVHLTLLLGLAQVALGSLVRGGLEEVAARSDAPPRGEWIQELGLVDEIHRNLSIWMSLLVILSWWWGRRLQHGLAPWLRRVTSFNLALVITQVIAGVVLAYGGLPPAFQVIHLTAASWLMGGVMVLALLLRRAAPSELLEASVARG